MPDRDRCFFVCKCLFALAAVLLLAGDAMAYTVPGPEFFGQFMSLAAWMVVAFTSVMLWPVYALMRRLRGVRPAPAENAHERG
jgi:hypothetical protein